MPDDDGAGLIGEPAETLARIQRGGTGRAPGVATAEEIQIDTLADRLRAETLAADGVVKAPDLVSAWTRIA